MISLKRYKEGKKRYLCWFDTRHTSQMENEKKEKKKNTTTKLPIQTGLQLISFPTKKMPKITMEY